MPEPLDDLLHQLPAEPMSADLPARIQLRLGAIRSREKVARLSLDAVLAVLAVGGLWALAPQWNGAAAWLTGGSVEGSMAWVNRLGSAPAPAVWETLTSALDWTRNVSDRFGVTGLTGLILLSIPLFIWLRRLMPETAAPFVLSEDGSGLTLEEGALA